MLQAGHNYLCATAEAAYSLGGAFPGCGVAVAAAVPQCTLFLRQRTAPVPLAFFALLGIPPLTWIMANHSPNIRALFNYNPSWRADPVLIRRPLSTTTLLSATPSSDLPPESLASHSPDHYHSLANFRPREGGASRALAYSHATPWQSIAFFFLYSRDSLLACTMASHSPMEARAPFRHCPSQQWYPILLHIPIRQP